LPPAELIRVLPVAELEFAPLLVEELVELLVPRPVDDELLLPGEPEEALALSEMTAN
jgi:hypothetical protein